MIFEVADGRSSALQKSEIKTWKSSIGPGLAWLAALFFVGDQARVGWNPISVRSHHPP
jgi:hypothetical protein